MAGKFTRGALIAGLGLIAAVAVLPTAAGAGGSGGGGMGGGWGGGGMGGGSGGSPGCGCPTPPRHHPHHPTVGVNVNTNVNVTVQTSATAAANANANASLRSSTQNFFGGGGGGGGLVAPAAGYIPGLAVQAGEVNSSYEATRTLYKKVVIQAFCFDDKLSPHPASQVTPDRDIDSAYDGELYRCIAGAHMQVTIADWKQNISFEGGRTLTCQKGEALYHGPGPQGGTLQCRPQRPARDCNERSLLRRFGAGIKVLTMLITEKYTATRQESTTSSAATALSLDGGVGGVAY